MRGPHLLYNISCAPLFIPRPYITYGYLVNHACDGTFQYKQEEIKYSHITFTDNTVCLELIEKPPRCILKLLAEQCHMPGGCDAAYLTNLHSEFDSHPDYFKGDDRRNWDKEFGIRHYAGTVTYKVSGFVDKNRDTQQDVFFDSLEKSKKAFVMELVEYKVRWRHCGIDCPYSPDAFPP